MDKIILLLRAVYRMKYKCDANRVKHQKNILYVKTKAFHMRGSLRDPLTYRIGFQQPGAVSGEPLS